MKIKRLMTNFFTQNNLLSFPSFTNQLALLVIQSALWKYFLRTMLL